MAQTTYTTVGRIHEILEVEEIPGGNYKKQIVILEVEGYKAPEFAAFEFFGDKGIEKLKNIRRGMNVSLDWNLKGRVNPKGKCYTTLSAWKITAQSMHPPDRGNAFDEHERNRERLRNPQPSGAFDESDDISF